jgi:hypothetical protein
MDKDQSYDSYIEWGTEIPASAVSVPLLQSTEEVRRECALTSSLSYLWWIIFSAFLLSLFSNPEAVSHRFL